MTTYNIIVNDKYQPECQKAVLKSFYENLESQEQINVIRPSNLSNRLDWPNLPEMPKNHLNMVLEALKPALNTYSIFLSGHIIPNKIKIEQIRVTGISVDSFTALSGIDLCCINNGCKSISDFFELVDINNYNQINDYTLFNLDHFSNNTITKNLISVSSISQRPWYYRMSPYRELWQNKVLEAYSKGYLNMDTIEEDIKNKYLRPSFLNDFLKILKKEKLYCDHTFLDKNFIPPEYNLSLNQLSILKNIDQEKMKLVHRTLIKKIRGMQLKITKLFIRYFIKTCYFAYSYSFRFLVKYFTENKGGQKSKD